MMLRRTVLYLPASTLGPALQIVAVLVLTHWLSPGDIGLYALIVAAQDLIGVAGLVWWSHYVLRYLAPSGDPGRIAQDRTELAVLAVSALAQALLAAGLAALIARAGASSALVWSAALSGAARSLVAHWASRARVDHRTGLYALAQVAAPALSLAVTLALFQWGPASVERVFAGMAIGHVAVAAILWPALGLARRGAGPPDGAVLRAAIRYGSFAALGAILAWVSAQSVRFATDAVLGTVAVGLISVGWGIGLRIAQQLAGIATVAVFPAAVERARREGRAAGMAVLATGGTMLLALVAPATSGIILLASPVAAVLTAGPFREMTALVLPLAVLTGTMRVIRHNWLDEVLQLAERPALMTALDVAEAALTALFCWIGALWHGAIGSVVGCLAASALVTLAGFAVAGRMPDFAIDWRGLGKVAAATAIMSALLLMLPMPTSAAALALVILAGAAAYAATLCVIARSELRRLLKPV